MAKTHNQPEEPVKKDDHLMDTERYLVATRPPVPKAQDRPKTRVERDIANLLKPQISANDWDSN
jgi:hypothetical protein